MSCRPAHAYPLEGDLPYWGQENPDVKWEVTNSPQKTNELATWAIKNRVGPLRASIAFSTGIKTCTIL
jgi:hypothetical protein